MNCPNANWNWLKKTKTLPKLTTISTTNWLAKALIGIYCLFLLGIWSCEAPKEIGLPPEKIAAVNYIDTLTVRMRTVLLDSVRTSNAIRLLTGNLQDPTLGKITTQPYFEVGAGYSLESGKTYAYDSLALVMSYTYFWGDTLKPFELNLHRLVDTIRTNRNYYSTNSVAYDPTPIAKIKVNPTPYTNSTITFKLPFALGKQIFDLAGKDEVSTTDKFIKTFKGFTIVPSASNTMIASFGTGDIIMNLYTHTTTDTTAYRTRFPVVRRFNNIQVDKKATVLSQLRPLQPLDANQTNGMVFIQDALGVVTKIDFPYLDKVLTNREIAINRAELKIIPNTNTSDGTTNMTMPLGLMLAETDETNRLLRSKNDIELLINNDSEIYQPYILPQLAIYNSKFKSYDFVLTNYFQALLTGFKKTKGLLLLPAGEANTLASIRNSIKFYPYMNTRLDRLTITPTRENVKLYLFYTTSK